MSLDTREHRSTAPAMSSFPRSSESGPNLATLDQLRAMRRRRSLPTHALRRPLPGEKVAC
ncbi:MAG TPA: hypothetical protein VIB11_10810 [Pedococcus sp.]|jgi:hypothetical protein|uniref:hypothetical protein n=1 Tax=Pedococcus sp. TaxID=2860345 RepID=UPI002F946478